MFGCVLCGPQPGAWLPGRPLGGSGRGRVLRLHWRHGGPRAPNSLELWVWRGRPRELVSCRVEVRSPGACPAASVGRGGGGVGGAENVSVLPGEGSDPASRGEGLLAPRRATVAVTGRGWGSSPVSVRACGGVGGLSGARRASGKWPREAALRGAPGRHGFRPKAVFTATQMHVLIGDIAVFQNEAGVVLQR